MKDALLAAAIGLAAAVFFVLTAGIRRVAQCAITRLKSTASLSIRNECWAVSGGQQRLRQNWSCLKGRQMANKETRLGVSYSLWLLAAMLSGIAATLCYLQPQLRELQELRDQIPRNQQLESGRGVDKSLGKPKGHFVPLVGDAELSQWQLRS